MYFLFYFLMSVFFQTCTNNKNHIIGPLNLNEPKFSWRDADHDEDTGDSCIDDDDRSLSISPQTSPDPSEGNLNTLKCRIMKDHKLYSVSAVASMEDMSLSANRSFANFCLATCL